MSFLATPNDPGVSALPPPVGLSGANSFDAARSIYNRRSSQLRKTRAALAKTLAGTALTRINCLGDSVTAGQVSQPATQSWPVYLRKLLVSLGYTISGTGFANADNYASPPDSRFTFAGTWNQGSNEVFAYCTTVGATVSFASDVAGTSATIYWWDIGGPWTYAIDGGAAVTITPAGTGALKKTTIGGLANTTHTILLTVTSLSGGQGIVLAGFEVIGANGISVTNLGIPGTKASDWLNGYPGGTPWYPMNFVAQATGPAAADCSFLCLGLNDANTGVTPATFIANMTTLVGAIQSTGSEVVLVTPLTPGLPSDGTFYNLPAALWLSYRQALYTLADSLNLPLIDLSDRGGPWAIENANGLMHNGDGFHCDPPGYAVMAGAALDALRS